LEYARLIGETDPCYFDEAAAARGPSGGLVAHPSFVVKIRGEKLVPDDIVRMMRRGGFDAGKDIEFGVPIRPGDVITVVSTVHDVYEKTGRSGSMYFIVFRSVLTNQRGEMVAIVDSRMMQKGR
jgi:acyl dehydratase